MKPLAAVLLSLILLPGCGSSEAAPSASPDPMSSHSAAPEAVPLDAAVPDDFATATFALGWFWGPDSRFGGLDGVIRTRVGYAGGTTAAPTYRSIGDHAETLQVDFDPSVVSYGELLDEFLAAHNACRAPFSRQYRSAIFVHDDAQRAVAEEKLRAHEAARDARTATAIEDFGGFTLAEDYHQKYRLRRDPALAEELEARFGTLEEFVDSPTVTRANAFVAGHGSEELRARDLPRMGLSEDARERLTRWCEFELRLSSCGAVGRG